MSEDGEVYQRDRQAAADEEFDGGGLAMLVPGNRGRMLDPRRTPVTVLGVDAAHGFFEVVVEAFEDAGAHWQLPLEDSSHFQFERAGPTLSESEIRELEALVDRFDRPLEVPASKAALELTLRVLEGERARIRGALRSHPGLRDIDLAGCIRSRRGSEAAADALEMLLEEAGLERLDRLLTKTYVSNPNSGELVKGHAIVIAEMGLRHYTGKIVRDEAVFEGDRSKERRRAHILLRLAFLQELMALLGCSSVELYRGMAIDGPLGAAQPSPLLAATFSREVAAAHFDSPAEVALLIRQRVSVSRLLMSFLETRAMNERYLEAEAVLIGESGNLAF